MESRHPDPYTRKGLDGGQDSWLGQCAYVTWVKDAADHARHDHKEHRHQLQVATQDAAGLDVGQVLPCQAALHNDLRPGAFDYLQPVPATSTPQALPQLAAPIQALPG